MRDMVHKSFMLAGLIGGLIACQPGTRMNETHKKLAEEYLRTLYSGDAAALDNLVSDEVVSTYPIYQEILGTEAIRGKEALKEFSKGFGQRWSDPDLSIDETIAEGYDVVVLWSFKATRSDSGEEQHWGGITLIRFDQEGRITLEAGEESLPGPSGRLKPGEL